MKSSKAKVGILSSVFFLLICIAGIASASVPAKDDFESYPDGTVLSEATNWYSGSSSPSVEAGIGVNGSAGVSNADNICTMSEGPMLTANRVKWQELAVGDFMTLSMDFQASDEGTFNDDRLGMMYDFDSTTSDKILGAQLEEDHIETYFDYIDSTSGTKEVLVSDLSLTENEWYTFKLTLTKLGDHRVQLDVSLKDLNGDLIGSGSLDTDTLDETRRPNLKYFTDDQTTQDPAEGGLWPAFKNFNASSGSADNFYFVLGTDTTVPYDPAVTPENEDGTFGTVDAATLKIPDIDLMFKASENAVLGNIVDPNIDSFNIYLKKSVTDDPNMYLIGSLDQGSLTDPSRTFSLINAIENVELDPETTYEWQVEEVLLNAATGSPYDQGDPNNIFGEVWSFTTTAAIPEIESDPYHTLTDSSGNAILEVTASSANNFEWYKVVGEQDTEGGESDDILISDSTMYSGTQTAVLSIYGQAEDGSEDAQYYVKVYNGTIPGNEPSATAWVWYPREVSHYKFDSIDGENYVIDSISGYNGQLMSGEDDGNIPTLDSNNALGAGLNSTNSLYFNNPESDPNASQYVQVNEPYAASFTDLTISIWAYAKGGGSYQRLFDFGNSAGNSTFICSNYSVAGKVSFSVDVPDHGERRIESDGGALVYNEWTHITATLTGNTAKLYINGEWVGTSEDFLYDPVLNGATSRNWIGRSQYSNDAYFNGYIDDMRIWNYALTNEAVGKLFLEDSGEDYVCNTEIYKLEPYDTNNNCIIDLGDLADFATRWLESDRVYPVE